MVEESQHGLPKLLSTCQTATVILTDSSIRVRNLLDTIVRDEEQLARLIGILEQRKEQTLRQIGGFLRGIEQACRRCETEGKQLLEQNLSFWRTWRLVFGKSEWQEKFQSDLEKKMRDLIQPQVENALQLLETDLRSLWPQLQDTMESHFKGDAPRAGQPDDSGFCAATARTLAVRSSLRWSNASPGRRWKRSSSGCFAKPQTGSACQRGRRGRRNLVTMIAAMSSAAVADVTGIVAASAVVDWDASSPSAGAGKFSPNITGRWRRNAKSWWPRSSSNYGMRSIFSTSRSGPVFAPLRAFCAAERKRYDPLLGRVQRDRENVRSTFWRADPGAALKPALISDRATSSPSSFGEYCSARRCSVCSPRDHEIIIVAIISPRAGRHVANFDKLPVVQRPWAQAQIIADRGRDIEPRAVIQVRLRPLVPKTY